ncbi:BrnA antitoxin family protein [Limnohabitans sp. Jir72]|uniref:BrnA antitoxin family protein n=1 Tax=Limnohabitans sp. Jir72 TaxID=1977909 RepID=UPI001E390E2A|nr:BrnA antitoxin family protein [Limnohabitans sp. Jir72]
MTLKPSQELPIIDWDKVDAAALREKPDDESPELTLAQIKKMKLLPQVVPSIVSGKTRITIMVDDTVLQAFKAKAGGRGYQTLINETLRKSLEADSLSHLIRQVVREELRAV